MVSIRHKSSTVAGKQPLPADLERGEIAVNLADAKLYSKDQTDAIIELGGGGAGTVPTLADVTVQAAAPYDESTDGSGYLTRIGGKTAGDADEYQITRVNLAVSDTAPANPHVGMNWTDTSGAPQDYYWNGARWVMAGDPYPAPGTFFADFTVTVPADATQLTFSAEFTGQAANDSFIQWGDGAKTVNIAAGWRGHNHVYAQAGTYVIRVTLAGPAASIQQWPQVTGTGVMLKKIGPLSEGARSSTYPFVDARFILDVAECDFTNLDVQTIHSAAQMFKVRPSLHPDNIKGFDWGKIDNINALMEDRKDISKIPFREAPEVTSARNFAAGTILDSVQDVSLPKCSDIYRGFWRASIGTFRSLNAPALSNAQEMFHEAVVNNFAGQVTTGPTLANVSSCFNGAYLYDNIKKPLFTDMSGVSNAAYYIQQGLHKYIVGYRLNGQSVRGFIDRGGDPGIEEVWDVEVDCTTQPLPNGQFGIFSYSQPALMSKLRKWQVTIKGVWGDGLPMPSTHISNSLNQLTEVGKNMYDTIDLSTLPDKTAAGPWKNNWGFKNAALSQADVDAILVSLDKGVTANGVGAGHDTRLYMNGGSNSAPSAGVVSGAIARLTAAGFTITTN